jgi:hypothetical protein
VDEPFDVLTRTLVAAIRQARQRGRGPASPSVTDRSIPRPPRGPPAGPGAPAQGRRR